jgi:hypothetical protein
MAREMRRAGADIRSLAEPYLDTTSDFAEIVFPILGVAAKLEIDDSRGICKDKS